jgi:RNA polymerase sigma-70 factor (ECF subfamily)
MTGKVIALAPRQAAESDSGHSDDEQMLLARTGRPGAFDVLVERHQTAALAVAYRYLGQRDLAKDAVQNAFVDIYRRRADYRPQGRFRAYLHRVVLNQCRMAVRSRGIRRRLQERLDQEEPIDPSLPDEEILARERARLVEVALLGLSDKLREVVVLHFSADLSHAEIADALGIKLGTVKSRLHAALVAMRAKMEPER